MLDLTLLPILILAAPSVIPPFYLHAALSGRPSYSDIFLLCLGMQTPLSPTALNEGEYPAVAAMTTGYVFRVENQAMVMFLQRVGRTGHLVTLEVVSDPAGESGRRLTRPRFHMSFWISALLLACGLRSVRADWFLVSSVSLLLLSRLLSIISLRAKTAPSWHGASEPGTEGDLLILLSQDRWVRMRGLVDDLKAVTSGSWLHEADNPVVMQAFEWTARVLVYLAVVILANATRENKMILLADLFISHGVLVFSNAQTKGLRLNSRKINISSNEGSIKSYNRRLDLAQDLVKEIGRSDWAIRLGIINPEEVDPASRGTESKYQDPEHEIVAM
ncbi:uncharacterized protein A1O9_01808 [Exophiala aquamarina CBS 119918]|uniref:Uncharacterized protein n=1 Tax=Exophiala aquamarina CBS 119918 TaxID=1182545 RepID=A0A072Q7E5_9EURO|nr:uncharacterized protein A1O9_01808 [Exophiala aquamarina CBS 119918]KEF63830.1 hypothetical protein A1O9_01808 [Exophiala aquamarina CBS 119918]